MNKAALTLATAALTGLTTLAATLSSGSAILNYSQSGVEALGSGLGPAPVLTLSTYFNQSESASRTAAQLGTDLIPGSTYTGQIYGMNGTSVVNLDGRTAQPTTFSYSAGDLAGHTGVIGLGGVARFDVFGGIGGSLLMGDLTLQYDINRTLVGGSGWFLKGNIPPAAALFDLTSVSIAESPAGFTLSGDMGVTFEVANFLLNTPTDTLRNVGTFTFTGVSAVPEPSTIALLSLAALLPFSRRAHRSMSGR